MRTNIVMPRSDRWSLRSASLIVSAGTRISQSPASAAGSSDAPAARLDRPGAAARIAKPKPRGKSGHSSQRQTFSLRLQRGDVVGGESRPPASSASARRPVAPTRSPAAAADTLPRAARNGVKIAEVERRVGRQQPRLAPATAARDRRSWCGGRWPIGCRRARTRPGWRTAGRHRRRAARTAGRYRRRNARACAARRCRSRRESC